MASVFQGCRNGWSSEQTLDWAKVCQRCARFAVPWGFLIYPCIDLVTESLGHELRVTLDRYRATDGLCQR